jgi:ubiquinone/menaquinone biosynthesis C-methylase UbiE
MLDTNRHFYNGLWKDALLVEAERFNTWPLVSTLIRQYPRRLEIAPGLRPRLPIFGTQFVDISISALDTLRKRGADTALASVSHLPFPDQSFDLICALDIIEHVDDDVAALAEIARIAKPGAALLLSTPLHQELWTPFDDFVGHRRRYEPEKLVALLKQHGFRIEQSAIFGMKPKSSRLVSIGMWFLEHRRKRAMWWYNRVLPFTVRFQKKLEMLPGLVNTDTIGEVLLVCRRDH